MAFGDPLSALPSSLSEGKIDGRETCLQNQPIPKLSWVAREIVEVTHFQRSAGWRRCKPSKGAARRACGPCLHRSRHRYSVAAARSLTVCHVFFATPALASGVEYARHGIGLFGCIGRPGRLGIGLHAGREYPMSGRCASLHFASAEISSVFPGWT